MAAPPHLTYHSIAYAASGATRLAAPPARTDPSFESLIMRARFLLTLLAAAAAACGGIGSTETHPEELTGTWARLLPDGRWGDTMQFRADGTLGGSATYPVPQGLTWRVEPRTDDQPHFCATLGSDGFCRPFELRGDSLVLIGGPGGQTVFRRVD